MDKHIWVQSHQQSSGDTHGGYGGKDFCLSFILLAKCGPILMGAKWS